MTPVQISTGSDERKGDMKLQLLVQYDVSKGGQSLQEVV